MISTWPASCSARSRSRSRPSARRSSIPPSARPATSTRPSCILQTASGKLCADLQFPPCDLRLRPAHRGAWLQGHARGGQCARDHGRARRRAWLHRRPGAELLPGALRRGLPRRARRLHRRREGGRRAEPERPRRLAGAAARRRGLRNPGRPGGRSNSPETGQNDARPRWASQNARPHASQPACAARNSPMQSATAPSAINR